MKKTILFSILALFTISFCFSQVNVTVTKKNTTTLSSVTHYLNEDKIQNVKGSVITYHDYFNPKSVVKYTVSENIDTILKRVNYSYPHLIKLWTVSPVNFTTRDTIIAQLFPIKALNEVTSVTISALPKAKSLAYISQSRI